MPKTRKRAAPNFISREIVLNAALVAFAESGFHGTSMRTIAMHAGTSLSNLYNYYPSKAYLLAFVLENTAKMLADRLEDAVEASLPGAVARLSSAVSAYVQFIVDQPKSSLIGITEFRYLEGDLRSSVAKERDRTELLFKALVDDGVAEGTFIVDDPAMTRRTLVVLCNSMSTWYRADGRLSTEQLQQTQINLALGIVRANCS